MIRYINAGYRIKMIFLFVLFHLSLHASAEFCIDKSCLDKIESEYGELAKRRALALLQTMNEVRDLDDLSKMEKVNDFFNQTPYKYDKKIWGVSDYWATRMEFIGKGKGDCEDFVIAKYFTLKELGIPTSKLFLSYSKSLRHNTSHMVLAYYETPESIPLILDNHNYKILPANVRDDLIPLYTFTEAELYHPKKSALGKMLPAVTTQNRSWDELLITQKKE